MFLHQSRKQGYALARCDSLDISHMRFVLGQISEFLVNELEKAFSPQSLEVINESHLHEGHQPAFDGTGETHFRIRIVAKSFQGKTRLERHRLINQVVYPQMQNGLHAIAIEAKAPGE